MSFKDGRIGVGKDPIFPLDISGSCRIDGDLILGGRFSDSQGNAIQLGSGSGATSIPDQTKVTLPSWEGGTITTQGLGVFKGKMDTNSIYITGDNTKPTNLNGANYNCTLGIDAGQNITSGDSNVLIGYAAGLSTTSHNSNIAIGAQSLYTSPAVRSYCIGIGHQALYSWNGAHNVAMGYVAAQYCHGAYNTALGNYALQGFSSAQGPDFSVAVGCEAGRYQGESDYNIWIGAKSGPQHSATIGSQTGDNNIAIGQLALEKITSGAENVVIGSGAGTVLTTATRNTILGFEAAYKLTSSGSNVIIGARAGYNSTATNNTFVGTYACNKNTSGGKNTSVGKEAGYNLTTGNGNAIMGYQAGFSHSTGDDNTYIGYYAGYETANGTLNTYVGAYAGRWYATRGNYNVAIGGYALAQGVGHNNVAIGYQSLYYGDNDGLIAIGYRANHQHHGKKTIAIGYEALYASAGNLTTNDGEDCIAIGYQAGYTQVGGNHCTMIGTQSGYSLTTGYNNILIGNQSGFSMNTGYMNVIIGNESGKLITNGQYNVLVGFQAGINVTTNYNTFIGGQAGYATTTGQDNVYVGFYAGHRGTGGYYNTFVGRNAGYGGSTRNGSNNVSIGYSSGYDLTTGSSNTLVGVYSGNNITTGHSNSCFGQQSGYKATGSYNTLIGNRAGYELTTGGNNTFVGQQAGEKCTTGESNVYIGHNANYYTTTGKYNIAIGRHAGCANGTGGSEGDYKLYIGTNETPNVTDSYGSASYIYGYMKMNDKPLINFNCNVGIGTASPMARLHIECNDWDNDVGGDCAMLIRKHHYDWALKIMCPNSSGQWGYGNYGVDINGTGSHAFRIQQANVEKIVMDFAGSIQCEKLGIGATSWNIPLTVDNSHGGNYHQTYGSWLWESHYSNVAWTSDNTAPGWTDASIYFSCYLNRALVIRNGGIWLASDERIKKNIVDVPDNLALQKVRNIPCRYYDYKEPTRNRENKTIGFIAQEVYDVFPMAVTKRQELIPDELRLLIENTNAFWTDLSDNEYKLYISDLENAIPNTECLFILSDRPDNVIEKRIQVLDDGKSFIFKKKWEKVFLHSKTVDDFHVLDKQKLFALNFSATQELDRKVIALENENAELDRKVIALENENAELKARLTKLEAFLGI